MREILFRGKRKDNDEWIEGNLFIPDKPETPTQICIGTNVVRITYDIIPETVGQYTGLTDKNGTKIFEGDILNCYSHNGVNDFRSCVVVWSELFLSFKADKSLFGDRLQTYEVIGNIHDNPELLKGGG